MVELINGYGIMEQEVFARLLPLLKEVAEKSEDFEILPKTKGHADLGLDSLDEYELMYKIDVEFNEPYVSDDDCLRMLGKIEETRGDSDWEVNDLVLFICESLSK